jgi:hypothetical protein
MCVSECVCVFVYVWVCAHVRAVLPPFFLLLLSLHSLHCKITRVGQNRIYTPYMTVCMVIFLLKLPSIYTVYDHIFGNFPAKDTEYIHHIYMVLANPKYHTFLKCMIFHKGCVGVQSSILFYSYCFSPSIPALTFSVLTPVSCSHFLRTGSTFWAPLFYFKPQALPQRRSKNSKLVCFEFSAGPDAGEDWPCEFVCVCVCDCRVDMHSCKRHRTQQQRALKNANAWWVFVKKSQPLLILDQACLYLFFPKWDLFSCCTYHRTQPCLFHKKISFLCLLFCSYSSPFCAYSSVLTLLLVLTLLCLLFSFLCLLARPCLARPCPSQQNHCVCFNSNSNTDKILSQIIEDNHGNHGNNADNVETKSPFSWSHAPRAAGRVVVELFHDVAPRVSAGRRGNELHHA